MKKIIFAILSVVLMLTLIFSVSVFAEDTESTADISETSANAVTDDEAGEDVNFLDRMFDALTSEKNGILDRVLNIVILVAFAVLGKIVASLKSKVSSDILELGTNSTERANKQSKFNNAIIEGFNTLVSEITKLEEKFDGAKQDESAVASLLTVDITLLEILTTIYPNSKNLPQGVKDIVEVKYANCLKIINSEDKLAAIINAIHATGEVNGNDGTNEEQSA